MAAALIDWSPLVQLLAPGGRLIRTWPLSGGSSATMTALAVATASGETRQWIVRQPGQLALAHNPHAAAAEFQLLQALHAHGLAVPKPYDWAQTSQLLGTPALVIEYLDGQPEFAPPSIPSLVQQAAAQLARIHTLDWANAGTGLTLTANRALPALSPPAPGEDARFAGAQLRQRLAPNWPPVSANAPVLLHGDYWPGNWLWRDQTLIAVVDWEDAALGDPLYDLAIARLDIAWIFGHAAMHAFTDRYLVLHPISTAQLPSWDLWAALRLTRLIGADLAGWVAFFAPYGRSDITEQSLLRDYQAFIQQALASEPHD